MAAKTTIAQRPAERGHIILDVDFLDEDGAAVVPASIAWTLYDSDGSIINARDSIAVTPLASSVTILVSGDDLAIPDATDLERRVLVEWTFDSSLGSDIPDKNELRFTIDQNLPTVS